MFPSFDAQLPNLTHHRLGQLMNQTASVAAAATATAMPASSRAISELEVCRMRTPRRVDGIWSIHCVTKTVTFIFAVRRYGKARSLLSSDVRPSVRHVGALYPDG